MAKARESLETWRSQTASEAKLARALREGSSTASLSRAIQEAAAVGIKVQTARRTLKLMQVRAPQTGCAWSSQAVGPRVGVLILRRVRRQGGMKIRALFMCY